MAARGYPRFTVDIDLPTTDSRVLDRATLLKLVAGGFLDLHDAAALLEIGERALLEAEVESRIADVGPDIHVAWRDLLTRLG